MGMFSISLTTDDLFDISEALADYDPDCQMAKLFDYLYSASDDKSISIEGYKETFEDKDIQGSYDDEDRAYDAEEQTLNCIQDDDFVPANMDADE